jgi:hypothetical protein
MKWLKRSAADHLSKAATLRRAAVNPAGLGVYFRLLRVQP